MTHTLLFDFSVDKENKSVAVQREFDAGLSLVWDAWTKSELLDQWWAPKPWKTKTKSMDFRSGGSWMYAMVGPDGETHWCRNDYQKVEPRKGFTGLDAFCDEKGNIDTGLPRSLWNISFSEDNGTTLVDIRIEYKELAELEKIIEMGFKEGFTMALENLDQYIEARSKMHSEHKTDTQPRVTTYLNFPGNTEEAFLFYKKVFRSEFGGPGIQRFSQQPADPNQPPLADSVKNIVLHVELPIIGNHVLMGTDAPKEMGFDVVQGNNIHISLEPETRKEADRIYAELSSGGKVTMPLQDMFWGAYFGSFTDRYGINWMVNCRAQ